MINWSAVIDWVLGIGLGLIITIFLTWCTHKVKITEIRQDDRIF